MTITRRALFALLASVSLATPAFAADDRGTRDEAKALCEAATAHVKKVGVEQAAKDFAADKAKWMPKDLFPFVQDFAGVIHFHLNGKLVGKNFIEVKDASGREFAKEMVVAAKSAKGNGWVDYEWAHPVTKKIEDKSAFIQRVPATEMLVGVGFYR